MMPQKFDKFKLSLILNIMSQESLQDPHIDVAPHITTRCH